MGSVVVFDVAKRKEPTESRGPKGVKVKDCRLALKREIPAVWISFGT